MHEDASCPKTLNQIIFENSGLLCECLEWGDDDR